MSIFFLAGAAIAFASVVSFVLPGDLLEPMWRVNPRAHEALGSLGHWAIVLMAAVCAACAASGVGLWKGARWAHPLALGLLVTNLLGDVLNALLGTEPRAVIGIPIAGAIIAYLSSRRARRYFR